jgi:hypothetical protein
MDFKLNDANWVCLICKKGECWRGMKKSRIVVINKIFCMHKVDFKKVELNDENLLGK